MAGVLAVLELPARTGWERGQLCGVRPPVHFNVFSFFMSFLKYTVHHHLGSVHVTKNSPGISRSGEERGQLARSHVSRASSSATRTGSLLATVFPS